MRAFPLLLLALTVSASAAPLLGTASDLRVTPLCRTYTCTLLKTHTVTSLADNVVVTPGGNVAHYSLTTGITVFDVWVSRNPMRKVTSIWARPTTAVNRAALPAAAELIRVTADIAPEVAMSTAEQWLKAALTDAAVQPGRPGVTPSIAINTAGKDGHIQITMHNQ